MSNYDHVAAIYDFAAEQGYKVQDFNTSERRNKKGRYYYTKVAFVVPIKAPGVLEKTIADIEAELQENSAEAQKAEVINNEI